ncbi:hypothetical protein ATERTT37_005039 [Aspergillus terreus]
MGRTLTYPKRSSNTVNRYKHRATYDLGAIHSIINSSQVLHVSFNPGPSDPFPAILPMIGQMGSFDYPSASIDEPLDYNYRSAILHGYAKLVTDEAEKLYAMELITNSVLPDRWRHSRVPPDRAEMSSTVILKVKVVDGSGKIRDGGVSDEKKDTTNNEVTQSVWTGVVPVWETFGEPIPSPQNKVTGVPEYITSFVSRKNAENQSYSEGAVVVTLPPEEQH